MTNRHLVALRPPPPPNPPALFWSNVIPPRWGHYQWPLVAIMWPADNLAALSAAHRPFIQGFPTWLWSHPPRKDIYIVKMSQVNCLEEGERGGGVTIYRLLSLPWKYWRPAGDSALIWNTKRKKKKTLRFTFLFHLTRVWVFVISEQITSSQRRNRRKQMTVSVVKMLHIDKTDIKSFSRCQCSPGQRCGVKTWLYEHIKEDTVTTSWLVSHISLSYSENNSYGLSFIF